MFNLPVSRNGNKNNTFSLIQFAKGEKKIMPSVGLGREDAGTLSQC